MGHFGRLGHGGLGTQNELLPRLVEALAGNKVIGASAGGHHTTVWTDTGELFAFGWGQFGQLGHGGHTNELVPRLVKALVGKKVVGASPGFSHTVVSTEDGDIFTFGGGLYGQLGHGGKQQEQVPRLVEEMVDAR